MIRKLSNLTPGPSQQLHYIVISFYHQPYHVPSFHILLSWDYIHFYSLYYCTIDFQGLQYFLPSYWTPTLNRSEHKSWSSPFTSNLFLLCSQLEYLHHPLEHVSLKSQSSLIISLSPRRCLAWGVWGEWWWWFEFNFVYPSVPLISSLNTHYHSFCSYSDHLT